MTTVGNNPGHSCFVSNMKVSCETLLGKPRRILAQKIAIATRIERLFEFRIEFTLATTLANLCINARESIKCEDSLPILRLPL